MITPPLLSPRSNFPAVALAMEITYLCAAREGDVFDLQVPDLRADGIFIEQNKTGKKQIKQWTPRLRATIELARQHFIHQSARGYVLPSPSGGRMNKKTFNTWWNNAKKEAGLKLGRPIPGTFHGIKAKAISDYEGRSKEKQLFSGHKTEHQVVTYDRKVKISPTLNIPPMNHEV